MAPCSPDDLLLQAGAPCLTQTAPLLCRWGATAAATDSTLWVYGGCAGAASKAPLTELHCLDLASLTWSTARQAGCAPDRRWTSSRQATFGKAAATPDGSTLLAFGRAQQVRGGRDRAAPLHGAHAACRARPQPATLR